MKQLFSILTAIVLFCFMVLCSGCVQQEKKITGLALEYNTETTYAVGETVRDPNNLLKLTYDDGTSQKIPIAGNDAVNITGDTSSVGKKTGTVSYGGVSTAFDYEVFARTEAVEVTSGKIQGYQTDEGIEVFKGIPYAAPPVGENRWRAPQDVVPWSGTKECFHFGPNSEQTPAKSGDYYVSNWAGYSEDCLYLNVWTKDRSTADKPVLLFIHGGGYMTGGASCPIYDGTGIAQEDVVFVSINYRLGVFGFFVSEELKQEDPTACGNQAILDMLKALEWVQENIAAFGGDKDNVTIMGQSAGADSVLTLVNSPKSQGLFHRAVALSGAEVCEEAETLEEAIASADLKGNTLAQLRAMPAEEVKKNLTMTDTLLDGYTVPDVPATALLSGAGAEIELLVGHVPGDTAILDVDTEQPSDGLIPHDSAYAGYRLAGSDRSSRTYVYYFDYIPSGAKNCEHTDDVPYWLNVPTGHYGGWTETDYTVAQATNRCLINFCKTGDPGEGWKIADGSYNYTRLNTTRTAEHLSDQAIAHFEETYPSLAKVLSSLR